MKITKETTISLGTLIAILPLAFWFFTKKADVSYVEKVEKKAEIIKEEIDKEENVNISQTVLIEQISKTVDLLNRKIDKELKK